MTKLHIITPVKNSIDTTQQTIESIFSSKTESEISYTVYNDFSNEETTKRLEELSQKYGFELIHLADLTSNPSPNYLTILRHAQKQVIAENAHLVIVESDVMVKADTIEKLSANAHSLSNPGMIAAVTTDENGNLNFPYIYAKNLPKGVVKAPKGISFCCSLLSNNFLNSYNFAELGSEKTWYDVFISHKAVELGFTNYILTDCEVLHFPHSSRPWKNLKTTNPLKYYWQKFFVRREKI